MLKLALATCAVAASCASPVFAATYSGTLNGIITSGTATYKDGVMTENATNSMIDLVGKTIVIDFTIEVKSNYHDVVSDIFYPKFVVSSIKVTVPIPMPLGSLVSHPTNDQAASPTQLADFTGNAVSGSYTAFGYSSVAGAFAPNLSQNLNFTYFGASSKIGTLSGGGTVSVKAPEESGRERFYKASFTLLSGSLSETAQPAPSFLYCSSQFRSFMQRSKSRRCRRVYRHGNSTHIGVRH